MKKKLISKCQHGEKVRDLNSQLLVQQAGPKGIVDTYNDGVVQLNLPTIEVRPEGVELTDLDKYRLSYENLIYTLRSKGYNNLADDILNVGLTQGIGNALYHYQDVINRRSELLKSKGAHWDENEAKQMGVAAMSAPYAPLAAIGAGKFAGNIIGNIVNNPIGFVADMAIGTGVSKLANKISEIRTGKNIYERAQERYPNDPVKATLSGLVRDPGTYIGLNTILRGKNAYKLSKNIIEAGGIKNYRITKAITNGLDTATPAFKKPSLLPRIITSSTTPTIQTGSNNISTVVVSDKNGVPKTIYNNEQVMNHQKQLFPQSKVSFEKNQDGTFKNQDLENAYNYLNNRLMRYPEDKVRESAKHLFLDPNSSLYGLTIEDIVPTLRTPGMTLKKASALELLSRPSTQSVITSLDKMYVEDVFGTSNPQYNSFFKYVHPSRRQLMTLSPSELEFVNGLNIKNWTPEKIQQFGDLFDSKANPTSLFNSKLQDIGSNILTNRALNIPVEYQIYSSFEYNPKKVPLKYYYGFSSDIPWYISNRKRIFSGFPARSKSIKHVGTLTDEEIATLAQDPVIVSKLVRYSPNVEGSVGVDDLPKTPLEFAIKQAQGVNPGIRGKAMANRIKQSNVSGYVSTPRNLSIDSYPLWEAYVLKSIRDGKAVLLNNLVDEPVKTSEFYNFTFKTNNYGRNGRYNIDNNLKTWLRQNKNVKLENLKTDITRNVDGSEIHSITYINPTNNSSTHIGNIKVLSPAQMRDQFNARRKKLYDLVGQKDFYDEFIKDATLAAPNNPTNYDLIITYPSAMWRKQGGKLIPRKQ